MERSLPQRGMHNPLHIPWHAHVLAARNTFQIIAARCVRFVTPPAPGCQVHFCQPEQNRRLGRLNPITAQNLQRSLQAPLRSRPQTHRGMAILSRHKLPRYWFTFCLHIRSPCTRLWERSLYNELTPSIYEIPENRGFFSRYANFFGLDTSNHEPLAEVSPEPGAMLVFRTALLQRSFQNGCFGAQLLFCLCLNWH